MPPQKVERNLKNAMASILNKLDSIDTNILIRPFIQDNLEQTNLAKSFMLNSSKRLYVDDSVISESVYVLTKEHYSRQEIVDYLCPLLENSAFVYDRNLFGQVFPFYLAHPSLSFEDCYLTFKIPEKDATPLWTFDQKFAAQSPTAKALA